MSDTQSPPMPQPTEEHARLNEHAGVWDVACTFFMGPDQPPMECAATETIEMFGPFFTRSVFESEMFGQPFKGSATLGFDPMLGKYVSTWFDTMTPALFYLSGNFDPSGKVLEMTGVGPDCMSGAMANYRTTEEHVSRDERVFEMFMTTPDGPEIKLFTHRYTRRS